MDYEALRKDTELQFHRVKALKEAAEEQVKQLGQQMAQLQGRHAVLSELIAKEQEEKNGGSEGKPTD